jgi:hypothetical protein
VAKEDNLIPFTEMSPSRHSELSRKGQKASAIAKREKASLKKSIKWLLEESDIRITKGPIYEEYLKQGIDISKLTPAQLATIGLWAGAVASKQENYKTLMEANEEKIENAETPEVNINIIDNSNLEKVLYEEDKEE